MQDAIRVDQILEFDLARWYFDTRSRVLVQIVGSMRPKHFLRSIFYARDSFEILGIASDMIVLPCFCSLLHPIKQITPPSGASGPVYETRGYHKPIMQAGGLGNVQPSHALKSKISVGSAIIVLGGPGMLIGLGGGAASSMATSGDEARAKLDFASVQRENPEMQRRCQGVIDACCSLDLIQGGGREAGGNPIQSIHDVGAGGLSNALPELVHDSDLGAVFELRDVLISDFSMSPMEIWCNESQERYVLAVSKEDVSRFETIAKRERCPFSVVGYSTQEERLVVKDRLLKNTPIDLPMSTLFGKPPKIAREAKRASPPRREFDSSLRSYLTEEELSQLKVGRKEGESSALLEGLNRVLHLPSVGSKSFLITIGDRSVTGLVARDQMVGPYQVPVSDVSVTRGSYGFNDSLSGEAMSSGERTPLSLINAASSARMAVGEALTNLAAASVESLERVKLSANWMCAASHSDEGAKLYDAVQAVGMDLCPKLGLSIPVGKDSMSMGMAWNEVNSKGEKESKKVTAPLSLTVTAFAPVDRIDRTWTPQLKTEKETVEGGSVLLFIDLADGERRMGGSALAQVFNQLGNQAPDVQDAKVLKSFFEAMSTLKQLQVQGGASKKRSDPSLIQAYHDRSDGGLITTILEMCFAGHIGAEIFMDSLIDAKAAEGRSEKENDEEILKTLFNEELGAVLQIRNGDVKAVSAVLTSSGVPPQALHIVGKVNEAGSTNSQAIRISSRSIPILETSRSQLQKAWSQTSFTMQSLRDNPSCAKMEFDLIDDEQCGKSRLSYDLTYQPGADVLGELGPSAESGLSLTKNSSLPEDSRPKVAILREQGVNGHIEMGFAFHAAGFEAIDVHMSDLVSGTVSLDSFKGLAACGGFSFGDVLGAGRGWALSILRNQNARKEFKNFFERKDTFSLGVCNGCQMLAQLAKEGLIPGTQNWPIFTTNQSSRYEGRVSMVQIEKSASQNVFFEEMKGSKLPSIIAHGEGRATFKSQEDLDACENKGLVALRYVEHGQDGQGTMTYPINPNGSANGIAGVRSEDGRVLAMMPREFLIRASLSEG